MADPTIARAYYDYNQGVCAIEPAKNPLKFLAEASRLLPLVPPAAATSYTPQALTPNILTRRDAIPNLVSANHIALDQFGKNLSAEITNPRNIALAFFAPALIGKVRQLGTVAEFSLAAGLPGRAALVRGGAGLMSLGVAACGAPDGQDYTSADAGSPPPNTDVDCNNLYDTINSLPSDQTFQALVSSLNLTSMNMDVKLYDNKVLVDAKGNLIGSVKPSEVVAWQKKGNTLFILTRTKADTNQDGPTALFAYRLNADNTLASNDPIPTAFPGGKAVILPPTDPINMSGIEYNGGDWLGITFGADSSNMVYLIDPAVPANVNANQPFNPRIKPDACAIKDDTNKPDAGGRD